MPTVKPEPTSALDLDALLQQILTQPAPTPPAHLSIPRLVDYILQHLTAPIASHNLVQLVHRIRPASTRAILYALSEAVAVGDVALAGWVLITYGLGTRRSVQTYRWVRTDAPRS